MSPSTKLEASQSAAKERRILLTRDQGLLKRRVVTHGCFVRATAPRDQLVEVVRRFDLARLPSVKTVRQFDEYFTAPHHGFHGAADYYRRASSLRVVERIRVPTLILSAEDDPFVPPEQFDAPELRANPHVTVVVTPTGGHCGFVAGSAQGYDAYWAEVTALRFAENAIRTAGR